jgi:hypothetical protein
VPRGLLVLLLLAFTWLALALAARLVRRRVAELRRSSPLFDALLAAAQGKPPARERPSGGPPAVERLVRCRRCGVHVVERLAVAGAGGPFCSPECRAGG